MPRYEVVIDYGGRITYLYDRPEIDTRDKAFAAASQFFEHGRYGEGPSVIPNNCLPVDSSLYLRLDDNAEEEVHNILVTQLS